MKDKGLRDTLAIEKQPKERQWKGLMINSTRRKGVSPEKGTVCGMRSPNKRGEENRKGKREVSKEKQHGQEKPDAAFGHGH